VEKGDLICQWDPYNAVIISEVGGKIDFEALEEGITFREEGDDQTGYKEKVIIDSRDKTQDPVIKILSDKKDVLKSYNIPVGAHIVVNKGAKISSGEILVKIPRTSGKGGDITGGLPRVTECLKHVIRATLPSFLKSTVLCSYGGIKRGNREIIITSRDGEIKKYLVQLSKHILVQDNDFVKAGTPLSDGAITPSDILAIKGPAMVQEYLVNEVQEVYRLQGVKINDKHFEVIVRQMMKKVIIEDPGDTAFLERESVDRFEFLDRER